MISCRASLSCWDWMKGASGSQRQAREVMTRTHLTRTVSLTVTLTLTHTHTLILSI